MIPLRRKIFLQASKVFDLMIMTLAFAFATWIVYSQTNDISFGELFSLRVKLQNFAVFVGFLSIWHADFTIMGLYQSRRLSTYLSEIKDIFKAVSLGTLAISIVCVLFRVSILTTHFVMVFWVTSFAMISVIRIVLRLMLKRLRIHGRNLRFLLIVGTNLRAVRFAKSIQSKPELGYRLIGFVDEHWEGIGEFKKTDFKLVSDLDNLPNFLRDNVVDEILISLPLNTNYQRSSRIATLCEKHGITHKFLPEIFNSEIAHLKLEEFENYTMISHYTGAMNGLPVLVKRIIDISLSLVLLIISAPLFLITAIVLKITSPEPVFFVQDRVGLNKRIFRFYKFRTMVADAEKKQAELEHLNEVTGPVFKINHDPRITPIGKLLRKTSLDELPQLINVLKGDMSLVGPRPLPIRDYRGFNEDWHRRRFSVRPGITCLWQVNGRTSLPFEKWMELDVQYIDNWSLWLDIKILAKTIPAVMKGTGAV